MKARLLIEDAALGPDDLKVAFQAFDGVWAEIASRYSTETVESARIGLATIVLSLIPDTKDPAEIQAIAPQMMQRPATITASTEDGRAVRTG